MERWQNYNGTIFIIRLWKKRNIRWSFAESECFLHTCEGECILPHRSTSRLRHFQLRLQYECLREDWQERLVGSFSFFPQQYRKWTVSYFFVLLNICPHHTKFLLQAAFFWHCHLLPPFPRWEEREEKRAIFDIFIGSLIFYLRESLWSKCLPSHGHVHNDPEQKILHFELLFLPQKICFFSNFTLSQNFKILQSTLLLKIWFSWMIMCFQRIKSRQ